MIDYSLRNDVVTEILEAREQKIEEVVLHFEGDLFEVVEHREDCVEVHVIQYFETLASRATYFIADIFKF